MRLGLQHSQTFTCKQPVSLAQGTAKRGRLASPNPVCTFAKQTCTLGRVPYCATWKGRATTLQQPTHHHYTRQHSLGRTIRQCQQEARVHAIVQDSTLPEPGSSDQQDNSQARDEAASTSYQPSRYVMWSCKHFHSHQYAISQHDTRGRLGQDSFSHTSNYTEISRTMDVSADLQCFWRLGWLAC